MTVATSASPGGTNTQVQFNDSGSFGGDSGFTFVKATDAVAIVGPLTVGGTLGVTGVTTLTGGLNTALTVPNGGTGVATQQAYGVLVGGTTATGAMQSIVPGTSGFVLTSAGTGALPTWAVGGTAVDDQNNILATQVFS
jgi:hypothetical protein